MNKSKELKNLEKVWEGIVFNLKNFAKSHKQEDLHQFRVNVKKLKAWLTLFSYTGKNKDIFKEFQKVRKIFKLAGRIRDKFIKEELLNSYSGIEKGNITISDDLLKEIDDFSSKLEKFLKTIEKAKRKLSKQIQPISNADI